MSTWLIETFLWFSFSSFLWALLWFSLSLFFQCQTSDFNVERCKRYKPQHNSRRRYYWWCDFSMTFLSSDSLVATWNWKFLPKVDTVCVGASQRKLIGEEMAFVTTSTRNRFPEISDFHSQFSISTAVDNSWVNNRLSAIVMWIRRLSID